MKAFQIINDDCLIAMAAMAENSIDSIVTDPPYGLSFMGKNWDHGVPGVAFWREALRVLKPGGHMLAFGGTRTYHRLVCAIEDAGFEIRDRVLTLNGEEHWPVWIYGTGFPKGASFTVQFDEELTGIDKEEDPVDWAHSRSHFSAYWEGFNIALKPAHEPICVARKPLQSTVGANMLQWGTGAINVDGCRVETNEELGRVNNSTSTFNSKNITPWVDNSGGLGRWPANVIHDGSDDVVAGFPMTAPSKEHPRGGQGFHNCLGRKNRLRRDGHEISGPNDNSGPTARFFYCSKASKKDRDDGLEHLPAIHRVNGNKWTDQDYRVAQGERPPSRESGPRKNIHPTVKPTNLMRYLCRLVTPPGGIVLDPFCGSGSTGKAAILEGFRFIGIEIEEEYAEIGRARVSAAAGGFQDAVEEDASNNDTKERLPKQLSMF